jgi:hypothetical protein
METIARECHIVRVLSTNLLQAGNKWNGHHKQHVFITHMVLAAVNKSILELTLSLWNMCVHGFTYDIYPSLNDIIQGTDLR